MNFPIPSYSLVFTFNGEMGVLIVKEFEQPYKTPDVAEVEPRDFGRISVNGTSLKEIVATKLNEILPKGPPEKLPPEVQIVKS